jgi:aminoglycoside phosphotransferase (APT) family kinase protein
MMHDKLLGRGNVADVYAHDGNALKLFKPGQPRSSAFREAANLALLEGSGVPAPEALGVGLYDGRWGLLMTRVRGRCAGEGWPDDRQSSAGSLEGLVALHRTLHTRSGAGFPDLRQQLAAKIDRATALPEASRRGLRTSLSERPAGDRLCHGDFHPWNVILDGGRAVIIDWLDAACGDPAADLCRSYVLLHGVSPALAKAYASLYLRSAACSLAGFTAWLPYVAAARLSETVTTSQADLVRWALGDSSDLVER